MRTPPELVYAVWLDGSVDPDHALWIAQQWAVEAAERATPYAGPRLRGAVLVVDVEAGELTMPYAEHVASADCVRVVGVAAVGRQAAHTCPVCEYMARIVCDVDWRWRILRAR